MACRLWIYGGGPSISRPHQTRCFHDHYLMIGSPKMDSQKERDFITTGKGRPPGNASAQGRADRTQGSAKELDLEDTCATGRKGESTGQRREDTSARPTRAEASESGSAYGRPRSRNDEASRNLERPTREAVACSRRGPFLGPPRLLNVVGSCSEPERLIGLSRWALRRVVAIGSRRWGAESRMRDLFPAAHFWPRRRRRACRPVP
jgi:hypothetical protein